ncbi:MAG TPA: ABC transporter ATP-binding protein [Solirubrobacterales bacterium]|jgi:ABC-type polysaccharide/polyol phosphate transport system ATPase subunit|nr:ABC transporter ATP-binding protein [Solirubrobacterales bacterium]
MPVENITDSFPAAEQTRTPQPGDPLAIQVEDLHKAFRIPTHRLDSLKERAVHPFAQREYRELRALDGVSFEIRQGEFFGIVGRNGSGKSTLLKLLASIYRADSGTIRIAGRLAPFIELGVGFNVELTARENVVLNGVMMGLQPDEARGRLDAVIEFAGLEEFIDLKLKNYSSGMLVRLAFSLMLQVDADVLLIDEVLAVGDAAFQQKCADSFREMKAAGKTIVLVTHDMNAVEEYCHRAMLISDGRVQSIGSPGEVGRRYLRLNFERQTQTTSHAEGDEYSVKLLSAKLEGSAPEDVGSVEFGKEIRIHAEFEALEDFVGLDAGLIVANADGVGITAVGASVGGEYHEARPIKAGDRFRIDVALDNPLGPGHYFVHAGVNVTAGGNIALYIANALEFIVFGGPPGRGIVAIDHTITAEIER